MKESENCLSSWMCQTNVSAVSALPAYRLIVTDTTTDPDKNLILILSLLTVISNHNFSLLLHRKYRCLSQPEIGLNVLQITSNLKDVSDDGLNADSADSADALVSSLHASCVAEFCVCIPVRSSTGSPGSIFRSSSMQTTVEFGVSNSSHSLVVESCSTEHRRGRDITAVCC